MTQEFRIIHYYVKFIIILRNLVKGSDVFFMQIENVIKCVTLLWNVLLSGKTSAVTKQTYVLSWEASDQWYLCNLGKWKRLLATLIYAMRILNKWSTMPSILFFLSIWIVTHFLNWRVFVNEVFSFVVDYL